MKNDDGQPQRPRAPKSPRGGRRIGYRIALRLEAPGDLRERIAAIHAAAILALVGTIRNRPTS